MKDHDKTFVGLAILLWLLAILLAVLASQDARADEVKPEPVKADCSYIPKPSDEVYYTCSEGAIGMVEVKLWICGQPYTINAKCPK